MSSYITTSQYLRWWEIFTTASMVLEILFEGGGNISNHLSATEQQHSIHIHRYLQMHWQLDALRGKGCNKKKINNYQVTDMVMSTHI